MNTSIAVADPPVGGGVLTRRDLCGALQVSLRTVDRLIADGAIRVVRIGGSVRIPVAEVHRILNELH